MAVAGDAPKPTRKPRKTADDKKAEAANKAAANQINEALAFCEPAAKEVGEPYATHVMIGNGVMSTFDGILQFTHPINIEMHGTPQYRQLAAALKRAGAAGSITVVGAAVRVKAPGFNVAVPMLADPAMCVRLAVDPPMYALGEPWRQSLRDLLPIVKENGEQVMQVSFLCRNSSTTVTDRIVLVQQFHGVGFAPEMVIPRRFAVEVCKIKKDIVAYGHSDSSLTVHFADGSNLRTQLHDRDTWPDIEAAWPQAWPTLDAVPDGFYQAVKDLVPFIPTDRLYINEGVLRTHEEDGTGAGINVPGLKFFDAIFSAKRLLSLEGLMPNWALDADKRLIWGTQTIRGVMGALEAERGDGYSYTDDGQPATADNAAPDAEFAGANYAGTDSAINGSGNAVGATHSVPAQPVHNAAMGSDGFGPMVVTADDLVPAEEPAKAPPAEQTALSRYLAIPDSERILYRDPQHPAFINGAQWAQAGYSTAANPVPGAEDSEDGRRWYEGHQSFRLVSS